MDIDAVTAGRAEIAARADADGEVVFAREVRAGAWDHRNDVASAIDRHTSARPTNVLVEGDLSQSDLVALLDAAQAAWEALPPRKRVARFEWRGRKYRATSTLFRLQVATGDNRRFIAYRWHD